MQLGFTTSPPLGAFARAPSSAAAAVVGIAGRIGQQTLIVAVAAEGQADRYVRIDGYKRITALEQLGRTRWKRWYGR